MEFSIKSIIAIASGIFVFFLYVSNVRPVGWFDAVVGLIFAVIAFFIVKNFKGLKK